MPKSTAARADSILPDMRREVNLWKLADRYGVCDDDPEKMWHNLALALASRYEWKEAGPRSPGRKRDANATLEADIRLVSRVRWLTARKAHGKCITARKACQAIALVDAGRVRQDDRKPRERPDVIAIRQVFQGIRPPRTPDVWSKYKRAMKRLRLP